MLTTCSKMVRQLLQPIEEKAITSSDLGDAFPPNCTDDALNGEDDEIPIVDYSMLINFDNPAQRSSAIENLSKACLNYGFFIVKNHGIADNLITRVYEGLLAFFDLAEEEKRQYETISPSDRIRWGKGDTNHVSREFLKIAAHPQFHCPTKPLGLGEVLQEYSQNLREVGLELLRGIEKSLGLEDLYIEKTMKLGTGYNFFTANDYPQRLHSQKRIGQFPHCDPSLLILLIQNVGGGLQLEHRGKWLNANIEPSWIIVNVADHLEILTNGKYKSALHRVVVNNEERRVTLPMFLGPSLDALVCPSPQFVDENHPPRYVGITYEDYLEANQHHIIEGKSCMQQIRL
ncbi:hypothetical protein K2173_022964 [Erythroxylum novogranatense]|uniref:Fe2OG dioxygenase domain-containing protein n=1 Tax=Erythroxylum novogranatense TaxID=1862640 RepID=A0AAV8T7U7_9ROSI|nr:hypothetical protein K2173_022964 [Erythroxylum novogranatense]